MKWAPRVGASEDERGVIAPLTALLTVALVGMTAFAVDTAMMYSEHSQLQNGADSSALAIAQACAKDTTSTDCTSSKSAATILAGSNALDGVSNVPTANVNLAAGTVDVTTQARDTSSNNHFSLVFARALGIQTADIRASAQAKFGGYSAADVVPLTFSKCESDPGFTKNLQYFPTHGSGLDDDPGYECKTAPSSGWELPGGFGWLSHSAAGGCTIKVDVNNPWVKAETGSDFDSTCDATFLKWKNKLVAGGTVEILVPIFDIACPAQGLKKSDPDPCVPSPWDKAFRIEAFAQISIRGWHFIGGGPTYYTPEALALKTSLGLGNPDTGLFGKFVKKVTLAEAATLGGPSTYGSTGVQLSK
jgi:Flp pilus assembly protein TadG